MAIEATQPAIMKRSSKYRILEVGNHVEEVKDLGFWIWSLELLIMCHSPTREKPIPYNTCPLRVPIYGFLVSNCLVDGERERETRAGRESKFEGL